MKYVVFCRNLNLGRRNCPDKALLEQAVEAAGAMRLSRPLVAKHFSRT